MKTLRLSILLSAVLLAVSPLAAAEKPNIVLIVTDDQGWWDLGVHGNPYIQTPVLDQLAAEGVSFTRFYAAPVCALGGRRNRCDRQSDSASYGLRAAAAGNPHAFQRPKPAGSQGAVSPRTRLDGAEPYLVEALALSGVPGGPAQPPLCQEP